MNRQSVDRVFFFLQLGPLFLPFGCFSPSLKMGFLLFVLGQRPQREPTELLPRSPPSSKPCLTFPPNVLFPPRSDREDCHPHTLETSGNLSWILPPPFLEKTSFFQRGPPSFYFDAPSRSWSHWWSFFFPSFPGIGTNSPTPPPP